eukprot:SM000006S19436  [mRNA]  locus=s6:714387:717979:+ [translate_table: standard]
MASVVRPYALGAVVFGVSPLGGAGAGGGRGPRPARADLSGIVNSGNVKEVFSGDEFRGELEKAGDRLVVLDVSTKTCGPCRLIFPKLVKLSLDYPEAVFLKVNGDHSTETRVKLSLFLDLHSSPKNVRPQCVQALMREWNVRSVPMFRFYRNGEVIHSHTGAKEDVLKSNFLRHYEAAPSIAA